MDKDKTHWNQLFQHTHFPRKIFHKLFQTSPKVFFFFPVQYFFWRKFRKLHRSILQLFSFFFSNTLRTTCIFHGCVHAFFMVRILWLLPRNRLTPKKCCPTKILSKSYIRFQNYFKALNICKIFKVFLTFADSPQICSWFHQNRIKEL